jgi:hypothetical protein
MTIFMRDMVGVSKSAAPLAAALVASNPGYRQLIPRQFDDIDAMNAMGCRLDSYGISILRIPVGKAELRKPRR